MRSLIILFIVTAIIPVTDLILPKDLQFAESLRSIFIFAILGLGLNLVTGYTGLLNLGVAGFMAIGAYTYSILTCDIYPFQFSFINAIILTVLIGVIPGLLLGIPTLRLKGDYLAIVTLGFGEIVQDSLRNLEVITKGTQGINPLPLPKIFGYSISNTTYHDWYYLLLSILVIVTIFSYNLENSRIGRRWEAVREDELAASCMSVSTLKVKLLALSISSGICSLAGALYASYLGSSGEPGNYDFQVSIIVLCIVIVGGLGNIFGVLIGALLMVGLNSIVLSKISSFMVSNNLINSTSVFTTPNNWKYFLFGLALILTMRIKPDGMFPAKLKRL
jgi:branched-chain amino acid transport system permease protein